MSDQNWIEWNASLYSANPPTDAGELVDIVLRDGTTFEKIRLGDLTWTDIGSEAIAKWRNHHPRQSSNGMQEEQKTVSPVKKGKWIEVNEPGCPVGQDTVVDVQLVSGAVIEGVCGHNVSWDAKRLINSVSRWRLCNSIDALNAPEFAGFIVAALNKKGLLDETAHPPDVARFLEEILVTHGWEDGTNQAS